VRTALAFTRTSEYAMKRWINRFQVVADDGEQFEIEETGEVDGMKWLREAKTGYPVAPAGLDQYEIRTPSGPVRVRRA
jgi:hypothetical protein